MKETGQCPVCGRAELEYREIRPACEEQNDLTQRDHPDRDGCADNMSRNHVRSTWARGSIY